MSGCIAFAMIGDTLRVMLIFLLIAQLTQGIGEVTVHAVVSESAEIAAYAHKLEMPADFVTMCQEDLKPAYAAAFKTELPAYEDVSRADSLSEANSMIDIRHAYRVSFLKLCLSRAKRDLIP